MQPIPPSGNPPQGPLIKSPTEYYEYSQTAPERLKAKITQTPGARIPPSHPNQASLTTLKKADPITPEKPEVNDPAQVNFEKSAKRELKKIFEQFNECGHRIEDLLWQPTLLREGGNYEQWIQNFLNYAVALDDLATRRLPDLIKDINKNQSFRVLKNAISLQSSINESRQSLQDSIEIEKIVYGCLQEIKKVKQLSNASTQNIPILTIPDVPVKQSLLDIFQSRITNRKALENILAHTPETLHGLLTLAAEATSRKSIIFYVDILTNLYKHSPDERLQDAVYKGLLHLLAIPTCKEIAENALTTAHYELKTQELMQLLTPIYVRPIGQWIEHLGPTLEQWQPGSSTTWKSNLKRIEEKIHTGNKQSWNTALKARIELPFIYRDLSQVPPNLADALRRFQSLLNA